MFNIKFDTFDPDMNAPNVVNGVWKDERYRKIWTEIAPFEPMLPPKAPEPKFNYFESSYRVTTRFHRMNVRL